MFATVSIATRTCGEKIERMVAAAVRKALDTIDRADDVGAGLWCELRRDQTDCPGHAVHEDALPSLKAAVLEQSLPHSQT
jgi:hypothetical protein